MTPVNGEQNLLVKLIETTSKTATTVEALHESLLGEHGHIGRIDDDLQRLYEKDKDRRADLDALRKDMRDTVKRIEQSVQTSAMQSKSSHDKFSGARELVMTVVLLLGAVASGVEIARALH